MLNMYSWRSSKYLEKYFEHSKNGEQLAISLEKTMGFYTNRVVMETNLDPESARVFTKVLMFSKAINLKGFTFFFLTNCEIENMFRSEHSTIN